MRLLLTNDDGFHAPGLQVLFAKLKETSHELYIVAPESQQSATGHSITLFQPLFLTRYTLDGAKVSCAVQGTPADCVKLAIQGGICPKPDLVISGINRGPNLGTDVFYSGTVSAAMEGVLLGVPSVAVSLASYEFEDFGPAADFMVDFIDNFGTLIEGLININIPGVPAEKWKGVKITKLGKAVYHNVFELRRDPRGREYFWQGGELQFDPTENSDMAALNQNYVSITPMHSDLTDYQKLPIWQNFIKMKEQE